MIEVDMRQQQRRHIVHRDAGGGEGGGERGKRARRTGIDQGDAAGPVQHGRCDGARHASKVNVDIGDPGG